MPYVTCSRCALTAYTAARWTTTDDCPACGAPLAGARRAPSGVAATGASSGTATVTVDLAAMASPGMASRPSTS